MRLGSIPLMLHTRVHTHTHGSLESCVVGRLWGYAFIILCPSISTLYIYGNVYKCVIKLVYYGYNSVKSFIQWRNLLMISLRCHILNNPECYFYFSHPLYFILSTCYMLGTMPGSVQRWERLSPYLEEPSWGESRQTAMAGVVDALLEVSMTWYESTEDRLGSSAGFLEEVLVDWSLEEEVGVIGKEAGRKALGGRKAHTGALGQGHTVCSGHCQVPWKGHGESKCAKEHCAGRIEFHDNIKPVILLEGLSQQFQKTLVFFIVTH